MKKWTECWHLVTLVMAMGLAPAYAEETLEDAGQAYRRSSGACPV